MDWADQARAKTQANQQSDEYRTELRVREERIKDECGELLFGKLKLYVEKQITKFNSGVPTSQQLFYAADSSAMEEGDWQSTIPSFTIKRKQGDCRVYVKYSKATHSVTWKQGLEDGKYCIEAGQADCRFARCGTGEPMQPEGKRPK